jgi:ribonuclease Z
MSAVGTQILLTHNKDHFIVDAGDGTVRDLVSRKIDFGRIKGILITHEHFDHFSGLYSLLHFCRLLSRQEHLALIVPKPARIVNQLINPPIMYESLPYKVQLLELGEDEKISIAGLDVTTFSVEHGSANALGYSIQDEQGFRIVMSGDTLACENLERNLEGADIAVLEATYADDQLDLASKYGHMTSSQALELGKKAKRTILVHSNPEYYFRKFQCAVR